jgi:hypothetical protein
MRATMLLLGLVQPALMVLLAVICLRFLWCLDRSSAQRRSGNDSLRGGLLLFAVAGLGRGLLLLRVFLSRFAHEDVGPLLLLRDPDLVGEVTGLVVAVLGVLGALLMVRGSRALIWRDRAGEIPIPAGVRRFVPVLLCAALLAGWAR